MGKNLRGLVGVLMTVFLSLGCSESGSKAAATAGTPRATETTAVYTDITVKWREHYAADPTIQGNDQWEPVLAHVTKVEFAPSNRAYILHADMTGEDLRHSLPGVLQISGVQMCLSIQLYDDAPKGGIKVLGTDGVKAAEANGQFGVCQVTT
jgi:hypothetical protein